MGNRRPARTREAVIGAILDEGLDMDPERLATWTARHPEFAADIRALAKDFGRRPVSHKDEETRHTQFARLEDEALARASAFAERQGRATTLRDLLDEAGMGVPELARRISFRPGMLSDVEQGHVRMPVAHKFVEAIALAMRRAPHVVELALAGSSENLAPILAKADGAVSVRQVSWREFIEDSDLSEVDKAYWLDEP